MITRWPPGLEIVRILRDGVGDSRCGEHGLRSVRVRRVFTFFTLMCVVIGTSKKLASLAIYHQV